MQPYLSFKGNCAEAMDFYAQCLDGQILMRMTYGDSPMGEQTKPEHKGWIMHMRISARGQVLMASDQPDHIPFNGYHGFGLSVNVSDAQEGERIFKALSAGGSVGHPFGATFWSPGFGMLTDKFGVPWMVNTEPATTPA